MNKKILLFSCIYFFSLINESNLFKNKIKSRNSNKLSEFLNSNKNEFDYTEDYSQKKEFVQKLFNNNNFIFSNYRNYKKLSELFTVFK